MITGRLKNHHKIKYRKQDIHLQKDDTIISIIWQGRVFCFYEWSKKNSSETKYLIRDTILLKWTYSLTGIYIRLLVKQKLRKLQNKKQWISLKNHKKKQCRVKNYIMYVDIQEDNKYSRVKAFSRKISPSSLYSNFGW